MIISRKMFLLMLTVAVLLGAGGCATALIKASEQGDIGTVETMLANGADINELAPDSYGRFNTTPMAHAARSGQVELVKLLLAKGADVNAGWPPPLAFAAIGEQSASAQILIEHGVDIGASIAVLEIIISDLGVLHDEARKGIELIRVVEQSVNGRRLAVERAAREQRVAAEQAEFEKTVATYRNATPKPVLAEEARKFKVQAESAVREKNFADAAALYDKALTIAAWWPEGHFNRAIVLSETGAYATAIVEMKRYLLLVPDAPDARAAQDKIYEWERKTEVAAERETMSQPPVVSTSPKLSNSTAVKFRKGGK